MASLANLPTGGRWANERSPPSPGGRGGTDLESWYGYVPQSWPPFFRPVGTPQPTNLPSMCHLCAPHFQLLEKFAFSQNFSLVFGPKFQLSRGKISEISLPDPSFFKENPLPRSPTFGNPRGTRARHILSDSPKKSWVPPLPRAPLTGLKKVNTKSLTGCRVNMTIPVLIYNRDNRDWEPSLDCKQV